MQSQAELGTEGEPSRIALTRPSEGRAFADHLHESRSGLERTTSAVFVDFGFERVVPDSRRNHG